MHISTESFYVKYISAESFVKGHYQNKGPTRRARSAARIGGMDTVDVTLLRVDLKQVGKQRGLKRFERWWSAAGG